MLAYIATIDPPKEKFGLVAHIDTEKDSIALFLIHTELPRFIQSEPKLIQGVTKIDQQSHRFLSYDSWLRFGEVHACRYSEVLRLVTKDPAKFFGYASDEVIARLLELIPKCPELSKRWQDRYCHALGGN